MKNQLIPLTVCETTTGEYQPMLVHHGYQHESIEKAMSYRTGDYRMRPELNGLVRECGGMPIVELPYPEYICAVLNAGPEVLALWNP